MTEEVGGENLLEAVGSNTVLLCQDPLASSEHGNSTTVVTKNLPQIVMEEEEDV